MDDKLERLVRIGTVTSVDNDKRTARVKFQDTNNSSGELYVLASRPYIPDYEGPQQTEDGGKLKIKPWMPKVNAVVLVLYLPVENMESADGYILGEIGALANLKQWTDQ